MLFLVVIEIFQSGPCDNQHYYLGRYSCNMAAIPDFLQRDNNSQVQNIVFIISFFFSGLTVSVIFPACFSLKSPTVHAADKI